MVAKKKIRNYLIFSKKKNCKILKKYFFNFLIFLLYNVHTIRQWAIFRFHVCNMVMMTLDYRISVFRCTFLVCLLPQWFLAMTFANHAQKVWRWPFKKTPSTKLIMHCQKNIFRADTKKSNVTLREMLVIFMNVSLQHCQSGKSYWLAMTITKHCVILGVKNQGFSPKKKNLILKYRKYSILNKLFLG